MVAAIELAAIELSVQHRDAFRNMLEEEPFSR